MYMQILKHNKGHCYSMEYSGAITVKSNVNSSLSTKMLKCYSGLVCMSS